MPRKKEPPPSQRKKAPPPKRKKEEKPIATTSTGLVTLGEEPKTSNSHYLRHIAEAAYKYDRSGMSLIEISKLPELEGKVTVELLRKWRTRYGWVEKREEYFRDLSEELKNKIANSQMQSMLNLIESLDKVFTMTLEEIIGGNIEFSTAEGAINALLKVGKTNNDLRSEIADKLVPETGQLGGKKETTYAAPELSHEEARVAALSVIFMRNGASSEEATQKAMAVINKAKEEESNG